MAGHEQKPFSALRQPSELAAVVRGFSHGITIGPQQGGNLIEKLPPAA